MAYSAPSELISVGGCPTSGFTGGYSYRTTNGGAFVKSLQDLLSFDQSPNH